jgi:hypothetical protein
MPALAVGAERAAPIAEPSRRLLDRSSSVSVREALGCAGALGLLAFAMCAGHIRGGGLYYDDWSLLALARFPGHGGLLHGLWLDYGQRPGQVLYYAALDEAIGLDAQARLGLAAATLALEATCVYLLLRQLGLAVRHAAAIAVLVLTFPFSDSVWLWGVLSLSSLAIAAFLIGVVLAVRGLQSSGPRVLALHGASLSLYLLSVVSYEIVAVAGCLMGLLYIRVVGLRRARARWALDVVAIAATLAVTRAALAIDVATPSRMQSLAGMIGHAGLMAARGAQVAGAAALPVGGVGAWVGVGVLAAVLAVAAALRTSLAAHDPLRGELGRWLGIAGAGALVALVSWSVYLPAPDHYAPSLAGTVNRMNAAAALGIAMLVYAAAVLLARTLGRVLRLPASVASLGVLLATLALAGAYLSRAAGDARAWDAAAADQRRELADLHAALPRLPAGAAVYAFDAPAAVGPGVPVLNTTLDLSSAMQISYAMPRLLGVPLLAPARLTCAARGPSAAGFASTYGDSYLLDVGARRATPLRARTQCAAQAARAGVRRRPGVALSSPAWLRPHRRRRFRPRPGRAARARRSGPARSA